MLIPFLILSIADISDEMRKSPIEVQQLKELHDQEVGAIATVKLDFNPTEKEFRACVPQESKVFPKDLNGDWDTKIFTKTEMEDLMKCKVGDCAFNFSNTDLQELQKAKLPEERKMMFYKFLDERVKGIKGADPTRSALFLRSRDRAFEDCGSDDFSSLLNERPVRGLPFRMSVVKYSKKMRPTTRLLQGAYWKGENGGFCYGEALVFSTHYDTDRVEVWNLQSPDAATHILKLQIRHRIDLLNTWVRRLSKEKFRTEVREIAFMQTRDVVNCLQKAKNPAGVKASLTPTPQASLPPSPSVSTSPKTDAKPTAPAPRKK